VVAWLEAHPGAPVIFRARALINLGVFLGNVGQKQEALAPTLELQGRAYEVTALLDAPKDIALRSGLSARADIFLGDGSQSLAVPVEAVGTDLSEDKKVSRFVWVDRDGLARKVVVETGISDDRWEQVTSGLKVGDRVIVGPAKELRGLMEGERVSQREAFVLEGGWLPPPAGWSV
jgi:HlyD family secretion protein